MFKDKSFKFSGKEVSVVSFIFCTSLLVAFWLGYSTGHTVGFDYAQSANLNNIAKYPINDFNAPELDDESVEEIYARLSDNAVNQAAPELKNEVPALAPIAETKAEIKNIENSPVAKIAEVKVESGEKTIIANLDALPQESEQDKVIPVIPVVKTTTVEQDAEPVNVESKKVEEPIKVATQQIEVLPKTTVVESESTTNQVAKIKKVEPEIKTDVQQPKAIVPAVKPEQPKKAKVNSGWYAQVFAPQDRVVAEKLASTLRQSGFPVVIESAGAHYRVLVGPEKNKQQGQVLLQQLSREKYLPGTAFLKQVK